MSCRCRAAWGTSPDASRSTTRRHCCSPPRSRHRGCTACSPVRTTSAVHAGPFSDQREAGVPCVTTKTATDQCSARRDAIVASSPATASRVSMAPRARIVDYKTQRTTLHAASVLLGRRRSWGPMWHSTTRRMRDGLCGGHGREGPSHSCPPQGRSRPALSAKGAPRRPQHCGLVVAPRAGAPSPRRMWTASVPRTPFGDH